MNTGRKKGSWRPKLGMGLVKYNIKKLSRKYSTNKCKQSKAEEQLLNKDFQDVF